MKTALIIILTLTLIGITLVLFNINAKIDNLISLLSNTEIQWSEKDD